MFAQINLWKKNSFKYRHFSTEHANRTAACVHFPRIIVPHAVATKFERHRVHQSYHVPKMSLAMSLRYSLFRATSSNKVCDSIKIHIFLIYFSCSQRNRLNRVPIHRLHRIRCQCPNMVDILPNWLNFCRISAYQSVVFTGDLLE